MSLQIKIQGTLGAAAIADAMGAATENLTFDQIRTKFNGKVSTFLKPEIFRKFIRCVTVL